MKAFASSSLVALTGPCPLTFIGYFLSAFASSLPVPLAGSLPVALARLFSSGFAGLFLSAFAGSSPLAFAGSDITVFGSFLWLACFEFFFSKSSLCF